MKFEKDVHTALWGYEEWLVSAHHTAPSKIVGGGRLDEICPDFPLLVKKIAAHSRLSVQVHPNDETAKTVGGEAKTEMWCVLKPGIIFAGFRPGVTEADIERAVKDGSFEQLLVRYEAKEGECYFIPGGLVHAIGENTVVYEVQQSSNTTFRLYDWGRVRADGKSRELHVKEGLMAMDISLPPPVPSEGVDCRYFGFRKVAACELASCDQWQVVYTPSTDETELLRPGDGMELSAPSFVTEVR